MKKHLQQTEKENSLNSALRLDDNRFVDLISRHGQTILYTVLGTFGVLFTGYLWFAGSSVKSEEEFQTASERFGTIGNAKPGSPTEQKALNELSKLIAKQPDLGTKYDAPLAQLLIDRSDFKQAKPYAEAALDRVSKDQIPFFVDYAQITLLIASNHFEEAIKQSIALKEEMLKKSEHWNKSANEPSLSELLFAFNLLRIPFLQQRIGAVADEKQSWNEWKSYFNSGSNLLPPGYNVKALYTAAQLFTEGSVTLDNYIDMRMHKPS